MSNAAYWTKRMLMLEEASHRSAKSCVKQVLAAFVRSKVRINDEIEKWVARIAINNEVSMAEARKYLKGDELDDFHLTVEEYIALGQTNTNRRWEKILENASAKEHITRLEAMSIHLEKYLRDAFGTESELLEKLLEGIYKDQYTHAAYEIENGFGFGRIVNIPAVDLIVKDPWTADGRIFSDRIWTAMDEMKAELQDALLQQILSGRPVDETIQRMTQYVSDEVGNATRRASTLVMTESSAIANRATLKCYEDLDVEEVEIIATLDAKTCKTCGDKDGMIVPMQAFKMESGMPPFHANCRCTTAPYVEGYEASERMMRDPVTGRSEYIENMTYNEWAEKYLKSAIDDNIKTPVFRTDDLLDAHYNKHKAELGGITRDEYAQRAGALASAAASGDVKMLKRSDNSISKFRVSTNEFVVMNEDDTIRTYFMPSCGEDYWNYEIERNK